MRILQNVWRLPFGRSSPQAEHVCSNTFVGEHSPCEYAPLNNDLNKIIDWGKLNRVDFNAKKKPKDVFWYKRVNGLDFRTRVAVVDVPQADGLDMLGMQIQINLNWDKHIFGITKTMQKILYTVEPAEQLHQLH